jgi:hypothetical protein
MLAHYTHIFRHYMRNVEYLIFSQSIISKSILMTSNDFVYLLIKI